MPVRRWYVLAAALGALLAGSVIETVRAAAPGASPRTVTVAAFPVSVTAGDYDLYDFVVDFPPGSATPRHVHGGPVVVTVVSGQLVLQRGGGERVIKTGESFLEVPGDVHALINRSASPARISAAELIPKGADETTVVK